MIIQLENYSIDLSQGIDLAIPLCDGLNNPNCFGAPMPRFSPVVAGNFVGSTAAGSPVNFFNLQINPHGNGTHTECVGHIATERFTIRNCLRAHHFMARLISLYPIRTDNGDRVIFKHQLDEVLDPPIHKALIIRTLPNHEDKKTRQYTGTNPPFLHWEALQSLADAGVEHLLVDLPSVDKEDDGGTLPGHRAFWQYPSAVRQHCTITELIYVPHHVPDGVYFLNLQTAALDLDASPSRPVIYAVV